MLQRRFRFTLRFIQTASLRLEASHFCVIHLPIKRRANDAAYMRRRMLRTAVPRKHPRFHVSAAYAEATIASPAPTAAAILRFVMLRYGGVGISKPSGKMRSGNNDVASK